jgi:hypothetical protein
MPAAKYESSTFELKSKNGITATEFGSTTDSALPQPPVVGLQIPETSPSPALPRRSASLRRALCLLDYAYIAAE